MQPVGQRPSVEEQAAPVRTSWHHKLATFLFIMVCFEVGLFLAVFPGWTIGAATPSPASRPLSATFGIAPTFAVH